MIYQKLQYNTRGQLWDIRVSTGADVGGTWNRGALQFFYDQALNYGTSNADNNGNVIASKHYRPLDESGSTWTISTDSYSYDSLSRLTSVTEKYVEKLTPAGPASAETQQFVQSYIYNAAQNAGMTSAALAGAFLPMPGGKTLALERGLTVAEGLAIKNAKNILAKSLDTASLQGAAREAAGEVVAVKSTGVPYDHINKVKEGLQGLLKVERKISKSLQDSTLSSSARASLQRTYAKVRTGIQRTRKYITEHDIQ